MKYVYGTCEYNGFTDLYTSGQKHIHLEFFRIRKIQATVA